MWVSRNGTLRTTHEAFTVRKGTGPYGVLKGADIMAALTIGWFAGHKDYFVQRRNADGVLRAGVGKDVFMLCPDGALDAFEQAAKLGSAVGAYNAAIMHLERGTPADSHEAMALLERAVELGDAKAKERLRNSN